jgi:hypothetical protein
MAQCIPAMGVKAGALYRAHMPVRPHVAAIFPWRSSGIDQAMTSDIELISHVPAHATRLRDRTAEFFQFTG